MRNTALLSLAAGSLLLLAACNSSGTTTDTGSAGSSVSSDAAMTDSSSSVDAATGSSSSDASVSSIGTTSSTQARVIDMTVENFKFTPNVITAKKGENVVVHLSDTTGIHGFGSKDLGFNVTINPGETKDVVIPTDKAGTFSFRCTVPCGPGHMDMTGTITVS